MNGKCGCLPPTNITNTATTITATVAPVLRLREPSEEPEAPAASCPAWFEGSELTLPGCRPYVPPLLLDAMAEKTLYVEEAVAEDDSAEVDVCAIGF
jgi:hypothetical protein